MTNFNSALRSSRVKEPTHSQNISTVREVFPYPPPNAQCRFKSSTSTSPSASPPRYSSGSDAEGASVGCRSRRNCLVLDSGSGWLDREHHVFVDHFAQAEVLNACYAHAWDESGTRLLVAGGPLAYGLRGCYVGVWS